MNVLTHLRTIFVLLGAFTICCGLVTQMLARALGYAHQLGPALLDLGSVRIYAPFSYLSWSLAWAQIAPSLLVASIGLALVCTLAAYAIAIVVAKLEPIAFAASSPWRDLARWGDIGHYGLVRDEGLALGVVRRHSLARSQIVRSDADMCVFVGDPRRTDDAVLAALTSWRGSMVLVDARSDLADQLGRADVLRFAPGRSDTLSFNPLLAIRGGAHAWSDARRLAAALLSGERLRDEAAIDAFALLMLDQLLRAPVDSRTLAMLRHRLIDPAALIADLCQRWSAQPAADAPPAIWEMARVVRAVRAQPDAALSRLARIERALNMFADGQLAQATGAGHLNLAQFVAAATPQTLVLSLAETGADAAPLIHAMLAQLAAACARDAGAPELLIAIEAEASRRLAQHVCAELPQNTKTRVLVQAIEVAEADHLLAEALSRAAFVAIGPQTAASAESISQRAGTCLAFEAIPHRIPRWRDRIAPTWIQREVERVPAAVLRTASPDEALLLIPDQKPVRVSVLVGGGPTAYVASHEPARHDWSAPPVDAAPTPSAAVGATQGSIASATPSAAKLRRVLARKRAEPTAKGAPIR